VLQLLLMTMKAMSMKTVTALVTALFLLRSPPRLLLRLPP
jgi:hypothetical protein